MNSSPQALSLEPPNTEPSARLEILRQAYRSNPFPQWDERKAWLLALSEMIYDNKLRIAQAISEDFGYRSQHDTLLAEVFPSLEGIRHAVKHGKTWMKPQNQSASLWFMPASTCLLPQPLGVVGVIVPWNYPLFLSIGPMIAALAAGNRVLVKLSEYTPHFNALLDELLHEALGPSVVQIVHGGAEVAAEFSRLPFDHLLFTGSTEVGKLVMKAASENLVPVTLELGGKSPVIITQATAANTSRFKNAIARTLAGKAINAGQTCIAPDYLLVPEGCKRELIAHAKAITTQCFPEGTQSKDFTGIVSDHHAQRLQGLIDEVVKQNASVVTLMKTSDSDGRKMPLTLIFNAKPYSMLMREEIFGPVLPVVSYKTLDEALDYINQGPRPLALYLFDDDEKTQEFVIKKTISGGVCLNDTLFHIVQENLPFGGVGASGMGHYHGKFGFDTMSKLKPIFRQSRFHFMNMLSPPYENKLFALVSKLLTRRV